MFSEARGTSNSVRQITGVQEKNPGPEELPGRSKPLSRAARKYTPPALLESLYVKKAMEVPRLTREKLLEWEQEYLPESDPARHPDANQNAQDWWEEWLADDA
jgi:hypothetical protein